MAILYTSLPSHLPKYRTTDSITNGIGEFITPQRQRWHYGIRSRDSPISVVLAIYQVLKALGMQWREKRDLGGLGAAPQTTDSGHDREVNYKKAASIYFIETRSRIQDVVVSLVVTFFFLSPC
jgi:carbon catabolite-derepressing protein kinase